MVGLQTLTVLRSSKSWIQHRVISHLRRAMNGQLGCMLQNDSYSVIRIIVECPQPEESKISLHSQPCGDNGSFRRENSWDVTNTKTVAV